MKILRKHLKIQRNLVPITSAVTLQRLSNGMVGIFVPLVILQEGGSLLAIAGYFLLRCLTKLAVSVPSFQLIQRRGAHLALGLSFALGVLQLTSILGFSATQHLAFLVAGAVCLGLADSLNDNSRHFYISRILKDNAKSSSLATMRIAGQAADLLGPALGGLIGVLFGSSVLLASALIVLATCFLPLRKMGKLQVLNPNAKTKFTLAGAPRRDIFANICFTADEAVGLLLWPIYLAVVLGSFATIGGVATISALATIIAVWIAGHRGDKGSSESVLRQGAFAMSVVNILKPLAVTPLSLSFTGSAYNASKEYMLNAWNANYYTRARRKGVQFNLAMEIACDIGYTTVWFFLFIIALLADDSRIFFITAFALSAVIIWGALFITRANRPG
ncbi:MAG TPA: hypothetical protein VIF43_03830 [Patescibacteria group bacterium]|jgi:hypothetical protein